MIQKDLGGYRVRGPPLPIPNREVKPEYDISGSIGFKMQTVSGAVRAFRAKDKNADLKVIEYFAGGIAEYLPVGNDLSNWDEQSPGNQFIFHTLLLNS
ncbi:MAG: hypothetical protein GZ094_20445 [Mariniphaga sp.]|nr:hypothetical protein [Mariniphaga sp.]